MSEKLIYVFYGGAIGQGTYPKWHHKFVDEKSNCIECGCSFRTATETPHTRKILTFFEGLDEVYGPKPQAN